jgi:hypothetical protein
VTQILKPDYHSMGLSICMGQELRREVEKQLLRDLFYYHSFSEELRFDWSESCIEGRYLKFMDGSLENFSGISVFNADDQLIADGWMDFIHLKETDQLVVYWEFLDIYIESIKVDVKSNVGMPEHIRNMKGIIE